MERQRRLQKAREHAASSNDRSGAQTVKSKWSVHKAMVDKKTEYLKERENDIQR